ncbi:MAG TPA: HAD family hydrolase [Anaerolineae bacterium]|nr:HAD family hydrolase [Anaerolineae bacterium]
MTKPVICFDFDGTLVNAHGDIHPRDVEILSSEDRVVFVPATGRPLHAVKYAFQRNGLFLDRPISFPMVLQNGAVVYRPGEVLFRHTPFPPAEQAELLAISRRHTRICGLLFSVNQVEMLWPNAEGLRMVRRFDLKVQPFAGQSGDYTKLTCITDSVPAMNNFVAEIEAIALEKSFSLPTVLELTGIGVDKGQMLAGLLDELGLPKPQIFAAGDGENDLSLFEAAEMSFCPVTSPAAIKDRTDAEIDVAKTGLLAPILAKINDALPH